MAEKLEEVEITGESIAKYLESTDSDTAASKLHELTVNVNTLIERIQDLIGEDQMLSAVGAVSFAAVLTVAGEPQVTTMMGAGENVIIGLHELAENFKKLYAAELEKLKQED